jgi:hypothetical protein
MKDVETFHVADTYKELWKSYAELVVKNGRKKKAGIHLIADLQTLNQVNVDPMVAIP